MSKCQGIGFVGNVGSPVEWVAKNATFVVTDRLAVNSALTIKPGVTVKFALTGSNADGI